MSMTDPNRDDCSQVRHLTDVLGYCRVVRKDRLTIMAPAGCQDPEKVADAVDQVLGLMERKIATMAHGLRLTRPPLTVGLFPDRSSYESYVHSERLRGLTGSWGATHPVRRLCVALSDANDRSGIDLRVVAAHECVHLWMLGSGFCPAWHCWPRWLHEGLALTWDHLAALNDGQSGFTEMAPNPTRLADWRRINAVFDWDHFLRRDLNTNRRNHAEDYAASWALSYALVTREGGRCLIELVLELRLASMRPFDGEPAERVALAWLRKRFGSGWPRWLASLKEPHGS